MSLGSLPSTLWGPVMPSPLHSVLGHWPGDGVCGPPSLPGTSSSSDFFLVNSFFSGRIFFFLLSLSLSFFFFFFPQSNICLMNSDSKKYLPPTPIQPLPSSPPGRRRGKTVINFPYLYKKTECFSCQKKHREGAVRGEGTQPHTSGANLSS